MSDTLFGTMAVNQVSPPAIVEARKLLHDTVLDGETRLVARRIAPRATDVVPELCVMTAVWRGLGATTLRGYGERIEVMLTDEVVRRIWDAEGAARQMMAEGLYAGYG